MGCAGVQGKMEKQTKEDVIKVMNIGKRVELEQFLAELDPQEVLDVATGHRHIPAVQWEKSSAGTKVAAVYTKGCSSQCYY